MSGGTNTKALASCLTATEHISDVLIALGTYLRSHPFFSTDAKQMDEVLLSNRIKLRGMASIDDGDGVDNVHDDETGNISVNAFGDDGVTLFFLNFFLLDDDTNRFI